MLQKLIKKNHIFLLLFTLASGDYIIGQGYVRPNAWKKFRREVVLQIGAAGFLGDLGGRDRAGTDYSPVDLEFALTRPAIGGGYRMKFNKNINWYSSLNYLVLAGDDKLTNEPYRNNRNLNFKTNVFELSTRIEFGISSFRRTGVYSLKKSLGRTNRRQALELIGFIGVGAFYFNPKGRNPETGKYEKLYQLHTEGQGLPGGPKQYKRVSVSLPIGICFHYIVDKLWSVGVEFSYRKTFTDYIDDVSTTYYDTAALTEAYGERSGLMSDPGKGEIYGASSPNADGSRAQRGDKQKDSYATMQITIGRFFPPKHGRTKLRSKF